MIAYGGHDTQIHVAESVDLLLGLPSDEGAPRTLLVFGDSGFDFWVGTWEVRGAARPEAPPGRNVISLEQGGCVREDYSNGPYGGTRGATRGNRAARRSPAPGRPPAAR